jgi:hypothetical protein
MPVLVLVALPGQTVRGVMVESMEGRVEVVEQPMAEVLGKTAHLRQVALAAQDV